MLLSSEVRSPYPDSSQKLTREFRGEKCKRDSSESYSTPDGAGYSAPDGSKNPVSPVNYSDMFAFVDGIDYLLCRIFWPKHHGIVEVTA